MAYTKQNYQPGDVLTAEQMNKIQDAVIVNEGNIEGHIENKDNPHGITPAQIGAAPAGYGLGSNAPVTTAKLADLNKTGWYRYVYSASDNPIPGYGGHVHVVVSDIMTVQTAYSHGFYNAILRRCSKSDGTFYDWEWVNPPMIPGVEYRTTERWNGKVVYTKLIDFGALPNATEKTVAHGVYPAPFPLSVTVTAKKDSWSFTLPSNYDSETAVMFNSGGVTVKTTIDRSDYNAYATLKYTKD